MTDYSGPPAPGEQSWPTSPQWPAPPVWGQPPWYPPPHKGWQLGLPPSGPGSLAQPVKRLAARLLDGLFFVPVFLVLIAVALLIAAPHFGPIFPVDPSCPPGTQFDACPVNNQFPGFLWIELTIFVVAFVANVGFVIADAAITARWGRTPGKAVMGIRVIRVATREPLGFWRALGRSTSTAFAGALSWIGLLDPLWCLWDANSQCVHDKVVDTVVVSDA